MRKIWILCLILAACQTPNVVSFYNEEINFGKYKTFALVNPANRNEKLSEANKQSDDRIEEAITRELNLRGYQRQEPADLWVYYRVILDTNVNIHVDDYPSPLYYQPYGTYRTSEFKEGVLVIDIKDPNSRKTIWQGSLDLKYKSRKKNKVDPIDEAIHLIFLEYPFRAGESQPIMPEKP